MALIFPAALLGEPGPAAMLHARGTTTLNGTSVPRSSAIFAGDLVQTGFDSVANISATGSTVLILKDSLIHYDGNVVKLEHGGVTVSTSRSMATLAGGVNVAPTTSELTEFEVRDIDGAIQIAAHKGSVTVNDGSGSTTLAQGQETTRDASETQKKKKNNKQGATGVSSAATGAILNSPWAIGIGGAAIAGVTAWVLIQSENPASPTK
jgi:hypothetical protein